ncbi:uncharacterized protein LOC129724927 [Wyeomyia smithii]|uniref:uncharacterized protein LOC129724927 n=1 Tax=Wyeomyia smithii TaxID=174621 RepID=UPI002467BC45|nr:uncharacterized protein LOC129724927 [Wyeomyia smithii]
MADEKTKNFLCLHKLNHLIAVFDAAAITMDDFNYLAENKNELIILLPILRDRIDFCNVLKKRTADKATQADLEKPPNTRETLVEICERYEAGQKFLEIYRKNENKAYTASCRRLIKEAMVEHFFRFGKGHITCEIFTEMAAIIQRELPKEDLRTWYVPCTKRKVPVDCFIVGTDIYKEPIKDFPEIKRN